MSKNKKTETRIAEDMEALEAEIVSESEAVEKTKDKPKKVEPSKENKIWLAIAGATVVFGAGGFMTGLAVGKNTAGSGQAVNNQTTSGQIAPLSPRDGTAPTAPNADFAPQAQGRQRQAPSDMGDPNADASTTQRQRPSGRQRGTANGASAEFEALTNINQQST